MNAGPYDAERLRGFEQALLALIVRFGGVADDGLEERIAQSVAQTLQALSESASDGASLSARDVVRIRTGKFIASRVPPAVFRAPAQLASMRAEIAVLTRQLLGDEAARGSRF